MLSKIKLRINKGVGPGFINRKIPRMKKINAAIKTLKLNSSCKKLNTGLV